MQDEIETEVDSQAELNQWLIKKLLREKERTIENLEEKVEQLQEEESEDTVYTCIFRDCEEGMSNEVERARHIAKQHSPEKVASAVSNRQDGERVVDYLNSVASAEFLTELDKNLDDFDLKYEWKDREEEEEQGTEPQEVFDLSTKQKAVAQRIAQSEEEWVTSPEISSGLEGFNSQSVRNTYNPLKEEGVIETHKNYGVRLTDEAETAFDVEPEAPEEEEEEEVSFTEEVKKISEQLTDKQINVLEELDETTYSSSTDVAEALKVEPSAVKSKYPYLKKHDLVDAQRGRGVRLNEKGLKVRRFLEQGEEGLDVDVSPLSNQEQEEMAELFESSPDIEDLSKKTRMKLQQYYLEKDLKGRTLKETADEVYNQVLIKGANRENAIRRAYRHNPCVREVNIGDKTTYQVKKEIAEKVTPEQEEEEVVVEESKDEDTEQEEEVDEELEELIEEQPEPVDVEKSKRPDLLEYYLDKQEESKHLGEIAEEIFGIEELEAPSSERTSIYEAIENIDGIQSHTVPGEGNKKFYYLREEQRKQRAGGGSVEKVRDKYPDIDGTPLYEWIKKAVGKQLPENLEGKTEINWDDFTDEFAGEDGTQDRKAFQTLLNDPDIWNALQHELGFEADFKMEKDNDTGGDLVKQSKLVINFG